MSSLSSDAFIATVDEDQLAGLVMKLTGGSASPALIRGQIQNARQRAEQQRDTERREQAADQRARDRIDDSAQVAEAIAETTDAIDELEPWLEALTAWRRKQQGE